jgi:hypothetical protein
MSSFLYRGQDNRRLFNQSLTAEEYARREVRREAKRLATKAVTKQDGNTAPKSFFGKVVSNVKKFFGRIKH